MNLIQNAQRKLADNGKPTYFSCEGPITYDDFFVDSYRSSSVTLACETDTAKEQYLPTLRIRGQRGLRFGYILRAIHAQEICLQVMFFDQQGRARELAKSNITAEVNAEFTQQFSDFRIPPYAWFARLSVQFAGPVTACTFFAPSAQFVNLT